jgi:hypothetical protein
MTFTIAILANVIADIALIGGLAYLMSRPRRLTPHLATALAPNARVEVARRSSRRRATRSSSALQPAYARQSD